MEEIKRIRYQQELLDDPQLDKLVIKAVSMFLANLPKQHNYRVVFMRRPIAEIVASQPRMIQRLETDGSSLSEQDLKAQLLNHRQQVVHWLDNQENVQLLIVDYHDCYIHRADR